MNQVIRVCPPRDFDFTELGDAGTQTIRVAERIDCSQYQALDLVVRVHTDASIASGCSIGVYALSDGFTTDDPSQDFFTTLVPAGQTFIVFTNSSLPAAGHLAVATYTSALGAMAGVAVVGAQPDPAGEALSARLSIDLVLREC